MNEEAKSASSCKLGRPLQYRTLLSAVRRHGGGTSGKSRTNQGLQFALAALLTAAGSAQATNGLQMPGYGIKAFGMGGVGIALPQDSVTAANNPAGFALIGDRLDVGADLAFTKAGATVYGSDLGDVGFVVIPEGGYSTTLQDGLAVGVSVFGSGLHVDYGKPVLTPTNSNFSADLKQVIVAPTVAAKLGQDQAFGASLSLARQRLRVTGQQFPTGEPDPGNQFSNGAGLRLGWIGQLTPSWSVGAMYASRIRMGKLDGYDQLLADGGRLDIPEEYGVGVAFKASGKLTVAADYLRINWSDVKSLGNPVNLAVPLGSSNGSGLGWKDQHVYRIGASYAYTEQLDLRAGYSQATLLMDRNNSLLDFVGPVTTKKHLSLGATWKYVGGSELTLAYMRSFREDVNGSGVSTGVDVHDGINWLAIGFGYRF
jgi:long-chain fatty acid transport protein